jgi:hypothetical protein
MPGCHRGKDVDVVSVFEAVGAHANNRMDDAELAEIEACAIPGPWLVRRNVYSEHHGQRHRSTGHEFA